MRAVAEARIAQIRTTMDDQRTALLGSMVADPDDFDGREKLWMDREDLRLELDGLLHILPVPTVYQRVAARVFGRAPVPTVGAYTALILLGYTG